VISLGVNVLKAEDWLTEEQTRALMYLHPDSCEPLVKTCEKALIQKHAPRLREEFQFLLDNDRQSLQRMYNLLSRIPDGLGPLPAEFEEHVRRAVMHKIAKVYVDALLEVRTQYQDLVNTTFEGEAKFVQSLDNACPGEPQKLLAELFGQGRRGGRPGE